MSISIAITFLGLIMAADPASAEPYAPAPDARYHNAAAGAEQLDNAGWWTRFGDARLDALVEKTEAGNYDLDVAESRIAEADAVVIQARAPLLPTASIESSATMAPFDSLGFGFTAGGGSGGQPGAPVDNPEVYYTAKTALNVGVEIDITGRNVLTHRASKRDVRAARADAEAQTVGLRVRVAQAYFDLVAAKEQLEVVERQVNANRTTLELLEARFETTQSSALDVLQQRQALAGTETLVPQARTQIRVFEQQLAILTGSEPGTTVSSAERLPELPPTPAIGRPNDLVESRPELRAWQHRVEAAEQRRKSAGRAFAPTLRLTGQAGFQSIYINDANSQRFWTVGAALTIPLSTGGATLGRLRQAKAAQATATHQMSQATLSALQEVEEALVREEEQRNTLEAYERQLVAAEQALAQAREMYISGQRDFLPVLAAQTSKQQAELNVISAKRELLSARIQLHGALGDSGT